MPAFRIDEEQREVAFVRVEVEPNLKQAFGAVRPPTNAGTSPCFFAINSVAVGGTTTHGTFATFCCCAVAGPAPARNVSARMSTISRM